MAGMPEHHDLTSLLESVNGRGFGSYKRIAGSHDLDGCRLVVDHAQTDPFAPPSLMRVVIGRDTADLPEDLVDDHAGRVATADFLTRDFAAAAARLAPGPSGTGNGGLVSIGRPGQEVLDRLGTGAGHVPATGGGVEVLGSLSNLEHARVAARVGVLEEVHEVGLSIGQGLRIVVHCGSFHRGCNDGRKRRELPHR